MGARADAQITISGEIKTVEVFEGLVEALFMEGVCDVETGKCIGCEEVAIDHLTGLVEENLWLDVKRPNSSMGEIAALEDFCKEHGLWFLRSTSADRTIEACKVAYNPETGETVEEYLSIDGDSYIDVHEAEKILEEGGAEALAAFVRSRRADNNKANNLDMPVALSIAADVLNKVKPTKFRVVLNKMVRIEMVVEGPDEEAAERTADFNYHEYVEFPADMTVSTRNGETEIAVVK